MSLDVNVENAKKVVEALQGKNIEEVIAAGKTKLASVPSGGAAPAASAPTSGAPAAAAVPGNLFKNFILIRFLFSTTTHYF